MRLMCWQCDHPETSRAEYLNLLRAKIRARGWIVMHVEHDRRPFSYTIGLHDRGLPEFLVTGLAPRSAQWLLNTFTKRALERRYELVAGEQMRLPARAHLELVDVAHPDAHMGIGVSIEGPVRALQLVWADGHGRWPWSPDFDGNRFSQPVLGRRRHP